MGSAKMESGCGISFSIFSKLTSRIRRTCHQVPLSSEPCLRLSPYSGSSSHVAIAILSTIKGSPHSLKGSSIKLSFNTTPFLFIPPFLFLPKRHQGVNQGVILNCLLLSRGHTAPFLFIPPFLFLPKRQSNI